MLGCQKLRKKYLTGSKAWESIFDRHRDVRLRVKQGLNEFLVARYANSRTS